MKIREIIVENVLREFATDGIESVIRQLADQAAQSDQGSPEHARVMAIVDQLLAVIQKPTAQPVQTQPTQPQSKPQQQLPAPQVQEDLSNSDIRKFQALLAATSNRQERAQLEQAMKNPTLAKAILGLSTRQKTAGSEEQIKADRDFNKKIDALVEKLVAKIQGSMEALNSAYEENSRRGEDVNSEKPKKIAETTALQQQIKLGISGSFKTLHLEYGENPKEYKLKQKQVLDFMTAASESGIFTFESLLTAGTDKKANIFSLIPEQYREISNIVGQKLLSLTAGTGAGSWGPGEMGLCIMGSPVRKASKKGDLIIGDKAVELKASRDADAGARLNTDVLLNGSSRLGEYRNIMADLAKKVKLKYDDLLKYPIVRKGKVTGYGQLKSLNTFGSKTTGVLNMHVFRKLKDPQFTLSILEQVVKLVLKPEAHKFVTSKKLSFAVNQQTGEIEFTKFMEAYISILWDCYHAFDSVDALMVINPITGSYVISTSSKNLIKQIQAGVVKASGGIDFGDKQSKASPQLGIA